MTAHDLGELHRLRADCEAYRIRAEKAERELAETGLSLGKALDAADSARAESAALRERVGVLEGALKALLDAERDISPIPISGWSCAEGAREMEAWYLALDAARAALNREA